MEASNDIMIRISPNEGKITVEEDAQGVFSRKSITEEDLLRCFKDSLRTADEGYHSGFLPLNTISLYQSETVKRFVLWHPRLYADVSVYDTPYPHFPIPRLVFGFSLNQEGKASHCRIGVVADEIPTPETPMYYYPFSNVSRESGSLCVGANTLPIYKKPHKAHNLPAFLLSIPNNMHYYSSSNNKLGLEYRELMEHLKDKDPEYYYSDILIPKKEMQASIQQKKELLSALAFYISKRVEINFSKLRMNRVSITLYDVVKSTGEVKDVFRFTYEGRDYICLSHSERIRAGLEVAELIKRLLGVEYPTFIDDVESVPVIDNVRPTGQVFIAKVIKGTALQVQVADNTGVPKAA